MPTKKREFIALSVLVAVITIATNVLVAGIQWGGSQQRISAVEEKAEFNRQEIVALRSLIMDHYEKISRQNEVILRRLEEFRVEQAGLHGRK